MQHGKLTISPPPVLNIPLPDAQALLEAGNGDAALLYLHIVKNGGSLDAARAATELHRSDRDIELAAQRLRQMGILSSGRTQEQGFAPAPELPEYRARDVVRRSMESEEFRALLDAVQKELGRILSSADVKKLFGLYDELALPADVIFTLVRYCKNATAEKYGREHTVGFSFIEKEAYVWVNREIVTSEQAEQWIEELSRRKSMLGKLRHELGIRDRELTKTEREYLMKWIDMGFPVESIAIAADRTITNTQRLSWKYMDSIIGSWHSMGLHTPEEIEKKDPRTGRKKKSSGGDIRVSETDDDKTMEQLKRIREKIRANQ